MATGQFDLAAERFGGLAKHDIIASRLAKVAQDHRDHPPAGWRGYTVLSEK
jgi:hypothetical protein